jgi:hypothetical protein
MKMMALHFDANTATTFNFLNALQTSTNMSRNVFEPAAHTFPSSSQQENEMKKN